MKIRCSPTNIGFLKKLGAQPIVIPPTEVYTALERGVVDGYVFPAALITDWGWEKLTKYIVNPGFYNGANVVLVNKKKWDEMPDYLQKSWSKPKTRPHDSPSSAAWTVSRRRTRPLRSWGSSSSIFPLWKRRS